MGTSSLIVLRWFLCLLPFVHIRCIPMDTGYVTVPWTHHGNWNQMRSFFKTLHISCDLEVNEPIEYFTLLLDAGPNGLSVDQYWSLTEVITTDSTALYEGKSILYPPRVSFHFHLRSSFEEINGTCQLAILTEKFVRPEPRPEPRPAPRLPPRLPPPIWTLPAFTDDYPSTTWSSTGSTDTLQQTPCMHLATIFPDVFDRNLVEPDPYVSTTPLPTPPFFFLGGEKKKRALWDRGNEMGLIPPEIIVFEYKDAIYKSMQFYEAQRSGDFDSTSDDEALQWLQQSGQYHTAPDGSDLSGGWYNGNDNVKLSFPMAAATTVLAWGYRSYQRTYEKHGLAEKMKEVLKWPLDYFLKSWQPDTETLFVQVGNLGLERASFERADNSMYENMWTTGQWPVYSVSPSKPGSDVAAEIASAMAITSQLNIGDEEYRAKLLDTAKQLYAFARKNTGKYSDHVPVSGVGDPDYTSSGYLDELCLSAAILYDVTYQKKYLNQAKSYYNEISSNISNDFSWDHKHIACAVKLYELTSASKYKDALVAFHNHWSLINSDVHLTPNGLSWSTDKGTLRHTANAAFILLQSANVGAFDDIYQLTADSWCVSQIRYILGDNDMKRSYQIGYKEENDIQNPLHKNSACPQQCSFTFLESDDNNVNKLVGALVGGPDRNDFHEDSRQNTLGNSVAVDYNAGFQSALVGILNLHDTLTVNCENKNNPTGTVSTWSSTYSSTLTEEEAPTTKQYTTQEPTTEEPTTTLPPYTTPLPTPIPNRPDTFQYGDALRKSLLFYAAQRAWPSEPTNNPVPWRQWGELSINNHGGWYDDGSSTKTTHVTASAVSIIGWGMIAFKKGYELSGTLDAAFDSIQWPLKYLQSVIDEYAFITKIGKEVEERSIWTRPSDAYSINAFMLERRLLRESIREGADVGADVATALAVGSVLYREKNATFSNELLSTAREIYDLAKRANETLKDDESLYYSEPGESYEDEMCVAAWWMFKAAQDLYYYQDGMQYQNTKMSSNVLDWKDKHSLCLLLTYEQTGDSRLSYLLTSSMSYWQGTSSGVHYTPQGLAWHDTEPFKYAANAAFVQALAETFGIASVTGVRKFGKKQIDYMLGNNDNAYSYQIGYGSRYPLRPHHRASSCPDEIKICDWSVYNRPHRNPHELTGALVAGPDKNDIYEDVRSNYTMNRVSIETNAGFQSVLAYIVQAHDAITTTTTTTTTTNPPTMTRDNRLPPPRTRLPPPARTTTTTTTTTTTEKVPTTTKAKTTNPPQITTKRPSSPVTTELPEVVEGLPDGDSLSEDLTSIASVVNTSASLLLCVIATWLCMYIKM